MSNFSIKIDLLKLTGAAVVDLQGKTAKKRCVVIPIEDANLFQGAKGVYLDAAAWEAQNPQYGDSHYIKQSLTKEARDKMTDEQKKQIPIIGNVKPIGGAQTAQPFDDSAAPAATSDDDNLPF